MSVNMDQLVLLSEDKAIDRYFDSRNYMWFVRLLIALFILSAWQLSQFSLDFHLPYVSIVVYSLILTACFVMFLFRKRLINSFQPTLVFFLFFVFTLISMGRPDLDGITPWFYIFPPAILFFRLKPIPNLFLFGWVAFLGIIDGFLAAGTLDLSGDFDKKYLANMIAVATVSMFCMVTGVLLRTVNQRRFVAIWRIEVNNRERLRMKRELDHARDIQLSLLPPGRPEIAHLDIACTSLPATEVGGDYYDYFKLSDDDLMLVIGDVSGHGVASGLVLSGVRSCLYLFDKNLPEPGDLLGKLNRMLKKTTDKRMFMTFMAVHFDTQNATLNFAMAGHQPLLHYCRVAAKLEEYPAPALPLGAMMNTEYKENEVSFHYGDIFLFYTDGMIEAHNTSGEEYGLKRLKKRFKTIAAKGASSEKIREVLMTDVQLFIGDAVQPDDMSLVVVRTHQKD